MIDFLGLGAMKAGSNWQRRWLATHPDIFVAPGEMHYWTGRSRLSREQYHAAFAEAREEQVVGEITPKYAVMDDAGVAALRDYNPDLRLFYCLRNPIDRAWAHIRMGHMQERLDLTRASHDRILKLFVRWVRHGEYRENIARWRRHFSAEQLHVFLFDDMMADPVATLEAIARHIGAAPGHFEKLPEADHRKLTDRVFAADEIAIPDSVLDHLRKDSAEPIRALGADLGRDLSHWVEQPLGAPPS